MEYEQLEFPWANDDEIVAGWESEDAELEKAEAELEAEASQD